MKLPLKPAAIQRADGVFGPSQLLAREIEKTCGSPVQSSKARLPMMRPELDYAYFETFQLDKYLLFFGTLGLAERGQNHRRSITRNLLAISRPEICLYWKRCWL
jgi:hypothetical protein